MSVHDGHTAISFELPPPAGWRYLRPGEQIPDGTYRLETTTTVPHWIRVSGDANLGSPYLPLYHGARIIATECGCSIDCGNDSSRDGTELITHLVDRLGRLERELDVLGLENARLMLGSCSDRVDELERLTEGILATLERHKLGGPR